jgi:hypothetical protein
MSWNQSPKTIVRLIAGGAGILALIAFVSMLQSAYGFLFPDTTSPQISYAWQFALSLGALIALVVIALAVVDSVSGGGPIGHYVAALVATAVTVPAVAATVTVVAYIARVDQQPRPAWNQQLNDLAVLVGVVVALLTWLLTALLVRRSATPQRMNSRTYSDLRLRLSQLDARLKALPAQPAKLSQQIGYNEAVEHRNAIAHELGCRQPLVAGAADSLDEEPVEGLRWVMATGYISLWSRIHRAEEALFEVNPIERVVSDGLYDELRLSNSNIPGSDDLQNKVRLALEVLEPAAPKYYTNCSPTRRPQESSRASTPATTTPTNSTITNQPAPTNGSAHPAPVSAAPVEDLQAGEQPVVSGPGSGGTDTGRIDATSAQVHAQGEDGSHGAVDANAQAQQQQVLAVVNTTSVIATPGSNGHTITVGAASQELEIDNVSVEQARGILREVRCSINSFRDSRWDGIVRARNRLMKTGIFTALAAYILLCIPIIVGAPPETIVAALVFYVVGAIVGLISRLRAEENSNRAIEDYGLTTVRLIHTPLFSGLAAVGGVMAINLLPSLLNRLTPIDTSSSNALATVPLSDIFSLSKNQMGLIIAAVFGLTPGLLIDRLMKVSDQYKADLQSSETSSGGSPQSSPSNQTRVS